jgi:hypothetical protein
MNPAAPQFPPAPTFINPETLDETRQIHSPYENQVNVNPAAISSSLNRANENM